MVQRSFDSLLVTKFPQIRFLVETRHSGLNKVTFIKFQIYIFLLINLKINSAEGASFYLVLWEFIRGLIIDSGNKKERVRRMSDVSEVEGRVDMFLPPPALCFVPCKQSKVPDFRGLKELELQTNLREDYAKFHKGPSMKFSRTFNLRLKIQKECFTVQQFHTLH